MTAKPTSAFLNVFLFSLFWALQIIISKMAFSAGATAVTFTLHSALVAALALSFLVLPKYYRQLLTLPKQVFLTLVLANAIHFGLGGFFSNAGVALTSAINAGFLTKFALVITILLAWLFLQEKLSKLKIVIMFILILGSYLISTKGQALIPQIGDLLIIAACLAWSIGNVMIRKALSKTQVSADLVSFLRPLAGVPILLLFILMTPLYPASVAAVFQVDLFDFHYYPYFIGSGIFMALLWLFLNRTLQVATASYMTMMSMMTPVFVSILAILFLGEVIAPVQILGGLLIIFAGIITHYEHQGRVA